jgi:hypothetical protein
MRYSAESIFGVESNYSANSNLYSKQLWPMNQGTQGYRLKKKLKVKNVMRLSLLRGISTRFLTARYRFFCQNIFKNL